MSGQKFKAVSQSLDYNLFFIICLHKMPLFCAYQMVSVENSKTKPDNRSGKIAVFEGKKIRRVFLRESGIFR